MYFVLLQQSGSGSNIFNVEFFAATLAIIGVVIIVSALLSGFIDRSGLPQVAVFLGLGAALGPFGLGLLNLSLQSAPLHVVAILSLTLVLFTDALSLNTSEVKQRSTLALRLLGPGTLMTAAIVGAAGWWLLDLPVAAAAILGAALASTDPVLLRGLLRRRDIPDDTRHALQLESGLNDAVLLPVVLIGIAFLNQGTLGGVGLAQLGVDMFILGPGAGVIVGLIGVAALDLVRKRIGIRRDYESLYSLGVAFTAFAAAEAVHGSGYLAAFTAGLTIAALDVELCDCFVEYGAVTAEMMLLFTFVLLGSSLIWSAFTVISGPVLLFTIIAVFIRTPIYLISLLGSKVNTHSRLMIAWFGPRGLSSLLLILLPVFAGVPGSEQLFPIASLVVLVSIVLHGGSPIFMSGRRARKELAAQPAQAPGTTGVTPTDSGASMGARPHDLAPALGVSCALSSGGDRESAEGASTNVSEAGRTDDDIQVGPHAISLEELKGLWEAGKPVTILDVRTERSIEGSEFQAKDAVRMPPDHVVERARELSLDRKAWLIAYCA